MALKTNATTYEIELNKGDAGELVVAMSDANGVAIPFVAGDIVVLNVKKKATDEEYILQKEVTSFLNGTAVISFETDDTEELVACTYVYDIAWYRNSQKKTIIPSSEDPSELPNFVICKTVTREVE